MSSFAIEGLFSKKRNALFSFVRHRLLAILKNSMIRVQSPEGTKRIEISPNATLRDLYDIIYKTFKLNDYGFALFKERNLTKELISSRSQTIGSNLLKHGDMIYMKQISGPSRRASAAAVDNHAFNVKSDVPSTSPGAHFWAGMNNVNFAEDEVDIVLSQMDGRIQRARDKLCQHPANGGCIHCAPLEPYDDNLLKGLGIKHMSFHSYLRKQLSGINKGKHVFLDDIKCKIEPGCREHLPWPKGICTKCQPSAITLNRQSYRHVDNVLFENTMLVERFLNYWRSTGNQRMGFLYGVYEINSDVPLGIRAHVAAIYEPPQESDRDSIQLLPDPYEKEVDQVAQALGLKRIGWIFTDLVNDDGTTDAVKHIRGIETHFLTSHECIMAAKLQNAYPNPCKYSPSGSFGSKFVTICVTGNANKKIHMEGYAVSAQCMALVRDNCLVPTKDAPELGYIRESSDKQYVPDVYYKETDEYGNEIQRLARPLPVEYLLVNVPATAPLVPTYTFTVSDESQAFPIENRSFEGQLQDFNALAAYLSRWGPDQFLEAVSDFHFLIFLYKMEMLPIKKHMDMLFEAIRTRNKELAYQFKREAAWMTLETLVSVNFSSVNPQRQMLENIEVTNNWTCSHCTYINYSHHNSCEVCGLPK